ncbi:MAG: hypothetical protein J5666_00810 [Bacilli bacterium]|nr:hypothetical protein [Bacilli bacterium]
MASNNNQAVIYLDIVNYSVHYYAMADGKITHDTRNLTARPFTQEYFTKLMDIVTDFVSKYTPANAANTTIVLPDNVIFTNLTTFPALKGNELKNTLDTYLTTAFTNLDKLKIVTYNAIMNKQFVTVCFAGVINDIIAETKRTCTEARLIANNVTFASNTVASALNNLSGKYKNETYMFLDIKNGFSRYIFVYKGKVVGFFSLPFGYEILVPNKMAAEDVLLYTPSAELLVINAKEKAKQKALTMSSAAVTQVEEESDEESGDLETSFSSEDSSQPKTQDFTIKTLPKKVARKLPKFMVREVPEEDERKVYENFRLFLKWTLDLLNSNDKIVSLGKPENIYVNLPSEFDYLFDIINEEVEDNGIKFVSAGLNKEKEEVKQNLELYGGFFLKDYKQSTNF